MNILNKVISTFSPNWALKREQAILALRYYDAARPSPTRNPIRDGGSGDNVIGQAGRSLLKQARYLDENHDIARGVLNDLVIGTIGTGITTEPMVKNKDGTLNKEVNKLLRRLWKDWSKRPETTGEIGWQKAQSLLCRSWLRDGDVFAQKVMGSRNDIKYPTDVPFAIELLETDMVPFDYNDDSKNIRFGIERDAWGRPKQYHVYKADPSEQFSTKKSLKRVNANNMIHIKFTDRISQSRGVSCFASIITRLDDIKDYEESERVAARVAAAMTGYIKRNSDFGGGTVNNAGERTFEMNPGMVFDQLLPGEDIGMIKSDRPSTALEPFRKGQMRAVASGVGASYSNIANDFDGSYSSQRQELAVQEPAYGLLRGEFVNEVVDPIWSSFVNMVILSSLLKGNGVDMKKVDMATIFDAEHRGPAKPVIDPLKEEKAQTERINNLRESVSQGIRASGGIPSDVFAAIADEQNQWDELGIKPLSMIEAEDNAVVEGGDNADKTTD